MQFDSTSLTRKQIKKRNKNRKKRDAEINMNIGHKKASKVRFQLSPQDNDINQEEMRAGKEHEQQDQENKNNSTLKLSFNNNNAHDSPINRKRKPEEEETTNPLKRFDPNDSDKSFEMDQEVSKIL